jgi:methionyl-tRNA formyltransferase
MLVIDTAVGRAAERAAAERLDLRHVSRVHDGDAFPAPLERLLSEHGADLLVSFLSPVVVPAAALGAVRLAPLNVHPAPPHWRGTGCVSYALYRDDVRFGCTVHVMLEELDAGPIVRVRYFPILPDDDNASLSARAAGCSLDLLRELIAEIAVTGRIPTCNERWHGPLHTTREFMRWATVSHDDPPDEVRRKIDAVRHPDLPGPFVELAGTRFAYLDG